MSRFRNTKEQYIRVGGTYKPIIDLESEVEIDLTIDDDDDEITFVGWTRNVSSSSNSNQQRGVEQKRVEKNNAMKSSRRTNEVGTGRDVKRPVRYVDSQISAGVGPPSTIRPEINRLGTKRQRTGSSPSRSERRTARKAESLPLNSYSPFKREFGEDLRTSDTVEMDYDDGVASQTTTYGMDCDEDNVRSGPRDRMKIESQYLSQPIARNSWAKVGNSNKNPSYDFQVQSTTRTVSNAPSRSQAGKEDREDADSEGDYETIHGGLDIHDESQWVPLPKNEARLEYAGTNEDWVGSSESPVKPRKERIFRTSRTGKVLKPRNEGFIWDLMADLRHQPPSLRRYPPSRSIRGVDFGKIKSEKAMRVKASFKVAPGAINRIAQHDGWLAIGTACVGGQADEPDEEHNPYNRSGSLLTWNEHYHILEKHFEEKSYGKKHYSINDVKYSNSGHCFLSAGMDKKVCVWSRPEGARLYSGGYNLDEYDEGVPFEVAFQPGDGESNVVAIGAQDIHVYAGLEPNARKNKTVLNLAPDHLTKHNVGVVRWDDINPHILYASSEPQLDNIFDGVHKSFDITKGKARLTYDLNEAGDAMAIHQVLALATRQKSKNRLRLFDRSNQDCAQEVVLERFAKNAPGREVSCMNFSPDGIYLALARMDNSVHVYDSRMLGKGVMQIYQHEKPRFITNENHLCGVTHAQWVTKRSGQYAILSGGEDGCVRLWNPMWSSEEPSNGQKIIEAHSEIGYFSVGDPFRNEHDLVVGDSSGEVTIYTGLLNHL